VSRHWHPEDALREARRQSVRADWPRGATAGLLLIAAACVGAALALYELAGPRDLFEEEAELAPTGPAESLTGP